MGYGWSEASHNRIVEDFQRNQVVFLAQGGMKMRWNIDGSNYIPSSRNSYTICEKDTSTAIDMSVNSRTPRFTLTFKDQSKYQFNDSGRFIRQLDRNDNAIDYIYNSTTEQLDRVEVDGGLNIHYERRADGQISRMREGDPNTGRLTEYVYLTASDPPELGPTDRLYKVINPEGEVTEYNYTSDGKLSKVIDPRGNIAIQYQYDPLGRKQSELIYGELYREYEYTFYGVNMYEEDFSIYRPEPPDPNIPNGSGLFTSTNFDDRQRVSTVSVGYWYYQEYTETLYDEVNDEYYDETYYERLAEEEAFTNYAYTDENNPLLKTLAIDSELREMSWAYDNFGNLTEMTDKEGYTTVYTYADTLDSPLNPKHRNLLRLIQRPEVEVNGAPVTYEPTELVYDSKGNLQEIIDVKDAESFKTIFTYTSDGLPETVTDRNGNTTEFQYSGTPFTKNQPRNLVLVRTPKGENPADGFREIDMTYDTYSNLESVEDDLGNRFEYTYDLLDRVTDMLDARSQPSSYTYVDGLLTEAFSPPNAASNDLTPRKTTFDHDLFGRVVGIYQQFDSTQVSRVAYSFDARSQLRELDRIRNGSSAIYSFEYDERGRTTAISDSRFNTSEIFHPPLCSVTETLSARGVRKLFRNNARCLLEEVLDIAGPLLRERTYKYDSLGRLIRSKYNRGGARYDLDVYNTGVYHDVQRSDYTYDKRDRLTQKLYTDKRSLSLSYDPESNLEELTGPNQLTTTYSYFRDNLLKEMRVENPGFPDRVFTFQYDAAGRLERLDYPAESGLVLYLSNSAGTSGSGFDANGNLLHLRYELDGSPFKSFAYTYDKSGNRLTMEVTTPSEVTLYEYGYDWFDRLTSVSIGINGATPSLVRAYQFDEGDNRVFYDDYNEGPNGATYYYTYRKLGPWASDQLETVYIYSAAAGHRTVGDFTVAYEQFEYDDDGNMTKRTVAATGEEINYEWSDYNRLLKVTSTVNGVLQENKYDIDGIRDRKTDKNGNTAIEYPIGYMTTASRPRNASSNAPKISYIQGPNGFLGYEEDGQMRYFVLDALQSVTNIVDSSKNVVQSYQYDEWGNHMSGSGTGSVQSPKTYWGGLSVNDETADTGLYLAGHRFFDPKLGRFISRDPIGHSGGLNLYALGANNPVTFTDHTGLKPVLGPIAREKLGEDFVRAWNDAVARARRRWERFGQEPFRGRPKNRNETYGPVQDCQLPYDYEDFLNGDDDIVFELATEEFFEARGASEFALMFADRDSKVWMREKYIFPSDELFYDQLVNQLSENIMHEPTHTFDMRRDPNFWDRNTDEEFHPDSLFKYGVDASPVDQSWR